MKIAVMSDTHLREGKSLPRWVWEQVEGVDLILHAGDVIDIGLLTDLKQVAPLEAVKGNCDGWELARLPQRSIVSCGEIKIGLTHGAEGPGRTTTERAMRNFEHDQVDLIIFGHSHEPYLKKHGEILLFNPGSPTDKRRQTSYSMGIVNIAGKEIDARHIFSESR
ncbi:phosphoesterase, MJ0936 family [Desulfitobacterium dichloroeliminans LMG P-21439]|uniref:Phosphoesterase n=1 Tax=Desulfitobacterium dichloroeliminans (strain LMG P-21439 / DCA1) TaxID=871963 RepID=L0F8P7_DESDL|nr:metallophosphoesterase [Desulfitobacterium dichloroeliminans]AGA69557.1 phosphoesterase, MJ0936 family [Desulfitobacterium dichloroeliminans LMG P-21439]